MRSALPGDERAQPDSRARQLTHSAPGTYPQVIHSLTKTRIRRFFPLGSNFAAGKFVSLGSWAISPADGTVPGISEKGRSFDRIRPILGQPDSRTRLAATAMRGVA